MSRTTYRIPDSVIEDTHAFRREVEKFLAGETSAVAFRAIRVPMGIYEQRENDTYMVRVRGAGGVFFPYQAKRIAELAEEFGAGVVHITTRQDLQIHRVLVENLPPVLESLLEVGLSPRGGGGNTPRNVAACPYAGVCADEVFDVTPHAFAVTEHLLGDRANFNLPRKFKVAFSGCSKDCGLCSVADIGFFAHERDGVRGFSVYAGGGMGMQSAIGILIEEFVPETAIIEVVEAVKRLFDKHGDRINRHKARLRFVLERVGEDEFRRLYREELEQVRAEGIAAPAIGWNHHRGTEDFKGKETEEQRDGSPAYRTWRERSVAAQRQDGLFMVRVHVPLGDVRSSELTAIAGIAENAGDGIIRTTQDQDFLLMGIPESGLHGLYSALHEVDERFVTPPSAKCVACAGASTCRLGLCLSRGLAEAIEKELKGVDTGFDAPIRISGCPNSCGQHPIAPIGLYGRASRENGKLAPVYSIVAGGRLAEGKSTLAREVAKVPAKAVPALLKDFWAAAAENRSDGESLEDLIDRWGADYLRALGKKYETVPPYEESPEFYRDYGSEEDFSLAGRGPGECGAGVMDVIALDIDEAKKALKVGKLYDAVVSTARALLVTRGLEPKKDREIFAAFTEHLIAPRWVSSGAQAVLDAAVDFRLGDRETLNDLESDIRALLSRVEELFKSLDSKLSFRIDPVEPAEEKPSNGHEAAGELDLRGVACPMNFVRAKLHLEQMQVGDILDILLDDGEPVRNVPASFAEQGQEVLAVVNEESHFRVKVRYKG